MKIDNIFDEYMTWYTKFCFIYIYSEKLIRKLKIDLSFVRMILDNMLVYNI